MGTEVISIIVLVVMFVIATTLPMNLGALAFVAAFGVGTVVLAPADIDRDRFAKQMLGYAGIVVAAGPLLAWALLVVPGLL